MTRCSIRFYDWTTYKKVVAKVLTQRNFCTCCQQQAESENLLTATKIAVAGNKNRSCALGLRY